MSLTLWRVSNYASLDGAGGLKVAGRWHSRGRPVIYCSEDPSTALLEVLLHMEIDAEDAPSHFQVLKIVAERKVAVRKVNLKKLGPNWATNLAATRSAGDAWLRSGSSLLLQVPSVLVPERSNFVLNPLHPDMSLLRITGRYRHPLDPRLLGR